MKMLGRMMLVVLCLFGMTLATRAVAQTTTDAIEVTRAAIQTERRAIVAKTMELTEPESQAFWPVYNEYWAEMNKVLDRRVRLITDYAEHWGDISDEKAGSMLDEFFKIQEDRLKVKKSYVKKFKKVLPTKKVARYYQVENKLDALIDVDLAQGIPLLK